MDTCKGARVSRTGWGHFELDLWHISYIIGGRNPKFSVWMHLGVVYRSLCLIYENLLSLGVFYQFVTQFMICLIINSQTVQFKGVFIAVHRRKDWIEPNQNLHFLFQRSTHTAWYREKPQSQGKTNFSTSQSCKPIPYDCTSVWASRYYFQHVFCTC